MLLGTDLLCVTLHQSFNKNLGQLRKPQLRLQQAKTANMKKSISVDQG